MNEEQFEAFIADCAQALQAKQALLQSQFGLDRFSRWQLEQDSSVLCFLTQDGREQLRFRVTPIGTYANAQETWKWAWANSKLPQAVREQAERVKALRERTDYDCFADADAFTADDTMAWELAAAAVESLDAMGCYRAPNRDTWLFLALEEALL
ncbi:MAG: hypothetical protein V4730_09040 [Pseudomonadota bacterium]